MQIVMVRSWILKAHMDAWTVAAVVDLHGAHRARLVVRKVRGLIFGHLYNLLLGCEESFSGWGKKDTSMLPNRNPLAKDND